MDKIVIVGSAGHAKVVIDIIESKGKSMVGGIVDSFRRVGENCLGYPILGCEDDLPVLVKTHSFTGLLIAIGDNFQRARMAAKLARLCPTLQQSVAIHPHSSVSKHAKIASGSVVMAGAVVNAGCSIGQGCIVNTGASLDHDSTMEDYSSLGPGAVTGGNCVIGTCTAIGVGTSMKDRIEIGKHSVIGAGSNVVRAIGSNKVALGNPAREQRDRLSGEPYFTSPDN